VKIYVIYEKMYHEAADVKKNLMAKTDEKEAKALVKELRKINMNVGYEKIELD